MRKVSGRMRTEVKKEEEEVWKVEELTWTEVLKTYPCSWNLERLPVPQDVPGKEGITRTAARARSVRGGGGDEAVVWELHIHPLGITVPVNVNRGVSVEYST